jgi:hypothetical protein
MMDRKEQERLQYELKKIYEQNPDFYKRSEADKKKYGEKRLIRLNQETLKEIEKNNLGLNEKFIKERKEFLEDFKKDAINFLKRKHF